MLIPCVTLHMPIYSFAAWKKAFQHLQLIYSFPAKTATMSETSFITTIRLKAAFYGLLSRFGFLVLSLYSFVFHFFQDEWINFCLIIDFLTFVFYDFQLKNCCDWSGKTNLWSTCLRTEQVWFNPSFFNFSNLVVICLLVFYKFHLKFGS